MNELVGATYTPTGTTVASTVCTYVYDVFGNKIEQEETVSGVTTITKFAYDGSTIWAAMSSGNALQTRYVYLDGSTTPVAQMSSSGTVNGYLTDYEGSVRIIVNNSTGASVDNISYDAYGNILSESSPVAGEQAKYAGYWFLAQVDLYQTWARFYDPLTGSWMQQDPIGFAGGSTNLQEYVGNDPTGGTDPTGLAPIAPIPPTGLTGPSYGQKFVGGLIQVPGMVLRELVDEIYDVVGLSIEGYGSVGLLKPGYQHQDRSALFRGAAQAVQSGTESDFIAQGGANGIANAPNIIASVIQNGLDSEETGKQFGIGALIVAPALAPKGAPPVMPRPGPLGADLANVLKPNPRGGGGRPGGFQNPFKLEPGECPGKTPKVEYMPSAESRGTNRLRPGLEATGEHTVFKRDPQTGKITGYETFKPQTNPLNPNPWESVKRVDLEGTPHFNKVTGQDVPTPHVHDPSVPGGVRPARPDEIPGGK